MTIQNASLTNAFTCFEVGTNGSGNNIVVKIVDARGKITKTIKQTLKEKVDKIQFNVNDLRKGKYIVNIFADDNFIKAVQYTKV